MGERLTRRQVIALGGVGAIGIAYRKQIGNAINENTGNSGGTSIVSQSFGKGTYGKDTYGV